MGGAARALALGAVHCSAAAAGGLGEATGAPAEDCDGATSACGSRAPAHWRHPARLLPATVVRQLVSSAAAPAPAAAEKPDAEYAPLRGGGRRRCARSATRCAPGAARASTAATTRRTRSCGATPRCRSAPTPPASAAPRTAAGSRPTAADATPCSRRRRRAARAARRRRRAVRDALPRRRRRRRRTRRRRRRRRRRARGARRRRRLRRRRRRGRRRRRRGGAHRPRGAAELAALNAHNERAPLPRSADGVGGDAGRQSALLAGHDSLHALYDWMLNQKVHFVLSTQLPRRSPSSTARRAPRVLLARHRRRRHVGGGQR